MKIVLVTGGFDPLHSGHIEYFKAAKKLGDKLIVGLNSDAWLARKKGQPFMPYTERMSIIENLVMVEHCVIFNDDDGSSIQAIHNVKMMYPDADIIFANGGDRTATNIPEMCVKDVEFVFGVGGSNKKNSSSWILEEWKSPKTIRPWGYYRVLHEVPGMKVKELTVDSGSSLSMQRHEYRAEYWIVSEGEATVYWDKYSNTKLTKHSSEVIQKQEWHRLVNETSMPLKLVEIQYGEQCIEEDIIRSDYKR
jgi:cytidyltransferase-like protein